MFPRISSFVEGVHKQRLVERIVVFQMGEGQKSRSMWGWRRRNVGKEGVQSDVFQWLFLTVTGIYLQTM